MKIFIWIILLLCLLDNLDCLNFQKPSLTTTTISLSENTPVGTKLQDLEVTGVNGIVKWTPVTNPEFLVVVSTTNDKIAELQLKTKVNYESATKSYTVNVIAEDTTPTTVTVQFIINVKDEFDEPPVFGSAPYSCTIPEEDTTTTCNTVSVTDADASDVVTCTLSGSYIYLFDPNSPTCQLKARNAIDRDAIGAVTSFPNMVITAMDKGGNSATATISVTISDINDNTPVCTNPFNVVKAENFTGEIAEITCTDRDAGSNGIITCTSSDTRFTISAPCRVSMNSVLDYDTMTTNPIIFNVNAADGGTTPKVFTSTVTLTTTGINDNKPVWVNPSPADPIATILENITVTSSVFQMAATDADKDIGGTLTYSIEEAKGDNNGILTSSFIIDNTGQVKVQQANLDRESYAKITFIIKVSDGLTELRQTATVSISDVNEFAPVFVPSNGFYGLPLAENTAADTNVHLLDVNDADVSLLAVTCTISSGDPGSVFKMDGTNKKLIKLAKLLEVDKPTNLPTSYILTVACSDGSKIATGTVSVSVMLINNHDPVSDATVAITKGEDETTGTIGSITVSDKDFGAAGELECSLTSSSTLFAIVNCQDIQLIGKLDYETSQTHTFNIKVQDKGNPIKSVTTVVTVTVTNVNDNVPKCTETSHTISEPEQAAPSPPKLLYVIPCSDADEPTATNNWSFHSGNGDGVFGISGKNLQLVKELDYETTTSYTLIVKYTESSPATGTATMNFYIHVTPVNEFTPTFTAKTVSVSENTPVGNLIDTFTASDADKGTDGTITYLLVNDFSTFSMANDGRIILIKQMDYEGTYQVYNLVVKATDGGGKSGTGTLTVSVIDENDHLPSFTLPLYQKTIFENITTGASVIAISATDGDGSAPNNVIKYQMITTQSSFIVNPSTGEITTASPTNIDYETTKDYTLAIKATDKNGAGLFTTCTVAITVSDVNEGTPTFSLATASQAVAEDTTVGSLVFTQAATDSDIHQILTYSITTSVPFSVDQSGKIYVVQALDFETTTTYTFQVKAEDNGNPKKSSLYTLTITVTDVNEFAPVCDSSKLSGSIAENPAVNDPLTSISCTDGDRTNTLTYSTSTSPFKMAGPQVQVASASVLDYETKTSYDVVILVKDESISPSKTTTVTYVASVLPVNEHPPVIAAGSSVFSVNENIAVGHLINTFSATDLDKGSNHGTITFSLSGGSGKFSIDANNGKLTVLSTLDYETKNVYNDFVITATDGGNKVDTASITININDINDNAPVASPNPMSQNVTEDVSVGSVVKDLTSSISDPDTGVGGSVSLAFKSGSNANGYFEIQGKLVKIKKSPLNSVLHPLETLVITLTDGGTPVLTSELTLQVNVKEANQFQPMFGPSTNTISIPEDRAVGSVIYHANATDADGNQLSGTLVYSLENTTNPNDIFAIDQTFGYVSLFKGLDRETPPTIYHLVIYVEDKGSPVKSNSMTVTITITDVNDNDPIFTNVNGIINTMENQLTPYTVFTAVANDKDEGANAAILYYIDSQTNGAFFTINLNSGIVTATSNLDRETYSSFMVRIKAEDQGIIKRSAYKNFQINVDDLNDNAPYFDPNNTVKISITENKPNGSDVVTIPAKDIDSGINAIISYSLSGTNAAHFTIDTSGKVQPKIVLDRESVSQYNLHVVAKDGGNPILTSSISLIIYVNDENDNSPVIGNPLTFQVAENSAVDTLVGTIPATDADIGVNAELTYQILSGNSGSSFKIANTASGAVQVNVANLDYESLNKYELIILVSDKGSPSRSTSGTLTILITDENDNTCTFNGTYAIGRVTENLPANTFVGKLTASDKDTGVNGQVLYKLGENIIESGLAFFDININTGGISTKTNLVDRENIPRYVFTVLCYDPTSTPRTGTLTLTVEVTDVNDNAPVQAGNYSNVQVYENVPVGYSIVRLNATDKDAANNSLVLYLIDTTRLDGVRANQLFLLQASTGLITSRVALDRETDSLLVFYAIARDQGNASLSTSILVRITILDINDNSPVFASSFYSKEVAYNITNGYSIGTVSASDRDQGINGTVSYRWKTNVLHFDMDATTGSITRKGTAVLYPYVGFVYLIQAVDQGSPSLTGEATIRIDTFDPARHAVSITVNVDNFETMLPTLLALLKSTLLSRYPNNRVAYMHTITAVTGSALSGRQLLATQTRAYYYAVADSSVDSLAKVGVTKTFISNSELLAFWRRDPDGTPTSALLGSVFGNISVSSVQQYITSPQVTEQWYQTGWGIAVLVLSGVLFLTLLALLIGCLVWKKKKGTRVDDSRRYLISNERGNASSRPPPNAPVYTLDNQESRIKTANVSNPVYHDNNPYGVGPPPQVQIDRLTEPSGQLASDRIITPVNANI